MGRIHRNCRLHLLLILPDGSRSHIPADWTDFPNGEQRGLTDHSRQVALASLSDLLHARSIIDELLRRLPASCGKPALQPIGKENKCAATEPGHSDGSNSRHRSVEQPERRTTRRLDRRLDETPRQDSGRNANRGAQS